MDTSTAPHGKQKICEFIGGLQICIHKFSKRQKFYDYGSTNLMLVHRPEICVGYLQDPEMLVLRYRLKFAW